MQQAMLTRDHAYRMLAWRLKEAGVEGPSLDARLLVMAACRCSEIDMIREPGKRVSADEEGVLAEYESRRLGGEPVSRILGRREFWGLDFRVTPATLDPRPDSETLVETALRLLSGVDKPSILDLGTGTGCLILAVLSERADAHGIGLDISHETLTIAHENACNLSLAERATFRHGGFDTAMDERFDLVISNPPYIPAGDIDGLATEVRDHDPRIALDGGADGLDCYRVIGQQLPRLLAPSGHAVIELGIGQGDDVTAIFRGNGLEVPEIAADLGGVPRALVARLPRA